MLNNAQLAVLEILAEPLSEQELSELKQLLIQFPYLRLQRMMDMEWDKRGYSNTTVQEWLNEHMPSNIN